MDVPLALVPALLDTTPLDVLRWLLALPVTIFHGYGSLLHWAAESVQSLFEDYGYWVILLGTFCENTLLLGLIVPGMLVVILAGLSAENGTISLLPALLLGVLGTIAGDTVSYFMGRFGWTRFAQGSSAQSFIEKVRDPILSRGALFVLTYHFAGYTRLVGPAAAGILKMPYTRWAPADHAGAALWITTFIGLGYGLGALGFSLDATDRWFRVLEWGLVVLVLIWGWYLFRLGQRTFLAAANDARTTEEEPLSSSINH